MTTSTRRQTDGPPNTPPGLFAARPNASDPHPPRGPDAQPSRRPDTTATPRRRRLAVPAPLAALAVAIALAAIAAAPAARVLTPAREVSVWPAVAYQNDPNPNPAENGTKQPAQTAPRGGAVQAPGWLEAAPFARAATALTDGVIEEILVLEGQPVTRGQVVARLIADDARLALDRASAAHAAAEARIAQAQAELNAAQTDWDNPIERDRAVAAAAARLAETDARLQRLPSLIAAEAALLKSLEAELERTRAAAERGAVNEIDLILQQQAAEAQRARLDAVSAEQPVLHAQRQREAAELDAAEDARRLRINERARLDAAHAGLNRATADARLTAAAQAEARLRLERAAVIAPADGLVQQRFKQPGDKVMLAGDNPNSAQILTIYDPKKLQVRVDVPLAEAGKLVVGQPCEIVVDPLPNTAFAGKVTSITGQADLQKNTLQVKVRVIDPAPILRPEMLARVKFLAGDPATNQSASNTDTDTNATDGPAVLVPASAVVNDAVWRVSNRRGKRGQAERVPVQTLRPITQTDTNLLVVQGPTPGDLVITAPTPAPSPGDRLRIRPAPQAAAAATTGTLPSTNGAAS